MDAINQASLPSQTDSPSPEPRSLPVDFTGSTAEYFRIWIVNVLLTLATFGVYWAWAKVRTRRYFYANTLLDGQAFDYLAKPAIILKGHLILFGVLVLLQFAEGFSQQLSSSLVGVGMCLLPYLIYKAHRFKTINSAYRNIRFKFLGSRAGAYQSYGLLPFFGVLILLANGISISMGLPVATLNETAVEADPMAGLIPLAIFMVLGLIIYPYFVYLQQAYFHGNIAYGGIKSRFTGRTCPYHMIYLRATFVGAISFIGLMVLVTIFIPSVTALMSSAGQITSASFDPKEAAFFVLSLAAMLVVIAIVNQYLYAKKLNYSWNNTSLGGMTFRFSLEVPDLIWIRLSNLVLSFLSLGLLIPWARVRRARYILSRIEVSMPAGIDDIRAVSISDEDALGDTAADFFDWEIGW